MIFFGCLNIIQSVIYILIFVIVFMSHQDCWSAIAQCALSKILLIMMHMYLLNNSFKYFILITIYNLTLYLSFRRRRPSLNSCWWSLCIESFSKIGCIVVFHSLFSYVFSLLTNQSPKHTHLHQWFQSTLFFAIWLAGLIIYTGDESQTNGLRPFYFGTLLHIESRHLFKISF